MLVYDLNLIARIMQCESGGHARRSGAGDQDIAINRFRHFDLRSPAESSAVTPSIESRAPGTPTAPIHHGGLVHFGSGHLFISNILRNAQLLVALIVRFNAAIETVAARSIGIKIIIYAIFGMNHNFVLRHGLQQRHLSRRIRHFHLKSRSGERVFRIFGAHAGAG